MANALTKVQTDGLKADAISGAKVADDAVNSEHYADGSIDTAHIADSQVTTAKIAADAVTAAKIADDAVGAEHIEDLDANVKFLDSVNAIFGTGNDLYIYHDGTNSYISDLGSGDFKVTTNGAKISFQKGTTETLADLTPDGSVDLYYDNSKKLATDSTGITVFGTEGGSAQIHVKADEGDDNPDIWRIIGEPSGPQLNFQSYNSGNYTNNLRLTGDQGCDLYYNNSVKLATTANGITVTGTVTATGGGLGLFSSYALVWDEKSSTTDGGTFDSGDWRTRDLNQEEDPDGIVSISSNEFTLGAGTYLIKWRCPAYDVQTHESRLVDVTNSNAYPGTTELAWSSETHQTWSSGMKRRTISGNTAFRIEHRCETSSSNNGFGIQGPDWSMANIFTQVEIYKES